MENNTRRKFMGFGLGCAAAVVSITPAVARVTPLDAGWLKIIRAYREYAEALNNEIGLLHDKLYYERFLRGVQEKLGLGYLIEPTGAGCTTLNNRGVVWNWKTTRVSDGVVKYGMCTAYGYTDRTPYPAEDATRQILLGFNLPYGEV